MARMEGTTARRKALYTPCYIIYYAGWPQGRRAFFILAGEGVSEYSHFKEFEGDKVLDTALASGGAGTANPVKGNGRPALLKMAGNGISKSHKEVFFSYGKR